MTQAAAGVRESRFIADIILCFVVHDLREVYNQRIGVVRERVAHSLKLKQFNRTEYRGSPLRPPCTQGCITAVDNHATSELQQAQNLCQTRVLEAFDARIAIVAA